MDKFWKCFLCSLMFGALFFVLSPGVLVTLPPTSAVSVIPADGVCNNQGIWLQIAQRKGIGGMCATSYPAVAVHSVIFMVIVFCCCWFGCDLMR
jgi:hypothetical protein